METEAIYIKHMDYENIVHSGSLVESGAWTAWRSISRQGCRPDIKGIAQSEQQTELCSSRSQEPATSTKVFIDLLCFKGRSSSSCVG